MLRILSAIAVSVSQIIPSTCRGINESFTATNDITKDIQSDAQSSATALEAVTACFIDLDFLNHHYRKS